MKVIGYSMSIRTLPDMVFAPQATQSDEFSSTKVQDVVASNSVTGCCRSWLYLQVFSFAIHG